MVIFRCEELFKMTPSRCQVCLETVQSVGSIKLQHHSGNYDLFLYLCAVCMARAARLLEAL